MSRIRIIADDKIPFLKGALESVADIRYMPGSAITNAELKNTDALIIRTRTKCNAALLKGTPVKFIATATIGFDHIDTDFCSQQSIVWTNAPGCNSSSVEQYIVSALLCLAREHSIDLGKTCMGIIGVGNVGSKVANAATALGMKVLLNDPPRALKEGLEGFDSLEKIKKEADIISFHVPLIEEGVFRTRNLADGNFFKGLKNDCILMNTSRGEVVNDNDLSAHINSKGFKAIVLDVWNNEPAVNPELLKKIYLATPHIAGYSTDGKANGTSMSVQAISRFFGLGVDNWVPGNVPLPESSQIIVDCSGKTEIEILHELYSETYDIRQDDALLKADISKFEDLRGNYRLRREPGAYEVKLLNNSWAGLEEKIGKLGFSVLAPNCFCEI